MPLVSIRATTKPSSVDYTIEVTIRKALFQSTSQNFGSVTRSMKVREADEMQAAVERRRVCKAEPDAVDQRINQQYADQTAGGQEQQCQHKRLSHQAGRHLNTARHPCRTSGRGAQARRGG
jgi:hypothetical protein